MENTLELTCTHHMVAYVYVISNAYFNIRNSNVP